MHANGAAQLPVGIGADYGFLLVVEYDAGGGAAARRRRGPALPVLSGVRVVTLRPGDARRAHEAAIIGVGASRLPGNAELYYYLRGMGASSLTRTVGVGCSYASAVPLKVVGGMALMRDGAASSSLRVEKLGRQPCDGTRLEQGV